MNNNIINHMRTTDYLGIDDDLEKDAHFKKKRLHTGNKVRIKTKEKCILRRQAGLFGKCAGKKTFLNHTNEMTVCLTRNFVKTPT